MSNYIENLLIYSRDASAPICCGKCGRALRNEVVLNESGSTVQARTFCPNGCKIDLDYLTGLSDVTVEKLKEALK